jgi:hypothetical protein
MHDAFDEWTVESLSRLAPWLKENSKEICAHILELAADEATNHLCNNLLMKWNCSGQSYLF